MKLRMLMVINAVVAAFFGIVIVLATSQFLRFYGANPNSQFIGLAQLYGASLITLAILTWSARNAPPSEARRAILISLFIGDLLAFVLALVLQLRATYNEFGWSAVIIYLLLAIGFGYYTFAAPESE